MTRLTSIILGTRGSELALTQTDTVMALLERAHVTLEVKRMIINTTGDRRQDLRLADVAAASEGFVDKGIFIKELELALESRKVDAAVHSLKDMPSELDTHFAVAAVLPRASVEDVLVSASACASLADLPKGARVGTSSVRRARQLKWLRPDIEIVEIRGNVPTRVRRVCGEDALDAVMLAAAGLERLELLAADRQNVTIGDQKLFACVLSPQEFLPAAGQGAIAIETLAKNEAVRAALKPLNHPPTEARIRAEREFLRLLGAGCQTPVGVHTWLEAEILHMRVRVFSEANPGEAPAEVEGSASMESPRALATRLAAAVAQLP